MHRSQAADIDAELLAFRREAEALEQPGRIWIGCRLEDAVGPYGEWRAFGRIHRLDRLARLLDEEDHVFGAISLHRTFAERQLLGRHRGRLLLHDILLGEFLEI